MSSLFTIAFLVFMLMMGIHRVWETFLKYEREPGKIIQKWMLPTLTIIHFIIGIGIVIEYFVMRRTINYYVTVIGLFLYVLGLMGRNLSVRTLGKYHSIHIEVRAIHPLIKDGVYKYIRHPYYVSVVFEILSISLIPNTYYMLIFSFLSYIPILMIKLYYEEKSMLEKFGVQYLSYKKDTGYFFPKIKRYL